MSRQWWLIGAALVSGLLLATAMRFGVLANEAQDLMCRQGSGGAWCSVRSMLGLSIHYQLFGLMGLALGLAGWVPKLRGSAIAGLLLASCGLLLYNTTYAAVAVVLSLLAALQPFPPGHHRSLS